jgi:hypothetical protein
MTQSVFPGPHWQKSSYSNSTANCVEVALGATVAVRDSKDTAVPPLDFPAPAWSVFLREIAR